MNQSYLRSIYLRLAGVLMVIVMLALGASAYLSHRTFEHALAPELSKKVASGGASVRALVLKAMENGIGFKQLFGVEQSFDDLKTAIPEVSYVALTGVQGQVEYQRFTAPPGAEDHFRKPEVLAALTTPEFVPAAMRVGNQYVVSMPVVSPKGPVGMLHVGVGVDFVDRIILDMLYDVLVILVVALFFTLELLNFMAGTRLEASLKALGETIERGANGDFTRSGARESSTTFSALLQMLEAARARVGTAYEKLLHDIEQRRRGPAHERPANLAQVQAGLLALQNRYSFGQDDGATRNREGLLARVRAPLFIFILAEEMTRPFLPGYIKGLLVPIPGLSPEIVVGLPIALFMFIVAICQPFLGAYSERVGNRHTMLIGAGIAAFGFAATAFAGSVLDLLIWRSLCALGYAMVFVAGQAHVLEHASSKNRARSFSLFVGAIMVATVCGPSIGGILADNIGERMTFGISALLALGSMFAVRQLPGQSTTDPNRTAPRAPSWREIGSLLVNRRFMTVTGLAAMPAKIVLTGMCFYLVPLYVLSIGSTQSVVGRILMLYAVVMVVFSPLAAAAAATRERMEHLVGLGLLISGLGGLLMLSGGQVGWVFAATFFVGVGQSLSIAAQSALVREHCDTEVAAMGESSVYGVYRLLERLGNAAGPLIAAVLVMSFGYRTSFVVIGAMAMVCGATFMAVTRRSHQPALAAA